LVYSLFDLTNECQCDGVSFAFGAVSNLEFLDFEVQLAHNTILSTNIHRSFWRRVIPHLFVLIDCANECIRFSLLEFSGHGISFLDATRPLIIFGCDETTHHFWMWDRSSFLDARFAWIKSPLPRMADSIARGCCQQGLLQHNVQADIFGNTHGLGMSNGGLTRRRTIDRGEPNFFLLQQVLILEAIWGKRSRRSCCMEAFYFRSGRMSEYFSRRHHTGASRRLFLIRTFVQQRLAGFS
jgi:hypothetical protein